MQRPPPVRRGKKLESVLEPVSEAIHSRPRPVRRGTKKNQPSMSQNAVTIFNLNRHKSVPEPSKRQLRSRSANNTRKDTKKYTQTDTQKDTKKNTKELRKIIAERKKQEQTKLAMQDLQRMKNRWDKQDIEKNLEKMTVKPPPKKMTFQQRKDAGLLPRNQYLKDEQRLSEIFHTSIRGSSLNAKDGITLNDLQVLEESPKYPQKPTPKPKHYLDAQGDSDITEEGFRRFLEQGYEKDKKDKRKSQRKKPRRRTYNNVTL